MERVKLYTNQSRDHYDNLAELYSLIVATEHLEKQFIKGTISPKDYTQHCLNLIAQFKTQTSLLLYDNPKVREFMRVYRLNCQAAENRLLVAGVPGTVEHPTEIHKSTKVIAEIVQFFITLMDSIKLSIVDIDQIHPQLSDLMQALNRFKSDDSGKLKIREWLILVNQRKASDQLTDAECRQLLFDLERL